MFRIYCPADFDYAHIVRDAGATLYAEADGVPFPSREWRDLPISVLTMWCEELRRSAGSASAAFSLCFMDGPYCIECQKDRDRVSMQFTEDEKPLFSACSRSMSLKRPYMPPRPSCFPRSTGTALPSGAEYPD